MKQRVLYAATLLFILLFAQCETAIEPPEHTIEIKAATPGFKTAVVNAKQIAKITQSLQAETGLLLLQKDTVSGIVFDMEHIMEVIDTLNNASYSFRFAYPDTPEHTFYNLVVSADSSGTLQTPYIVKYECDPAHFQDFKNNGYQFRFFKGSVKLHPFSHYFGAGDLFNQTDPECVQHDAFGDPIPCLQTDVGASGTGGGDPGTGFPTGNTTSGAGNSGGGGTGGYDITLTCSCVGHTENDIEAGICSCPNFILTINGNAGNANKALKSTDCPPCTLPGGSSGVNTYPMAVNQLNLILRNQLTTEQLDWLENNTDTVQELNDLLAEYDYSEDAKNATLMTITSLVNNNLEGPYNANYYDQINNYTQVDLTNPDINIRWGVYFAAQCAMLKAQNPSWSYARVFWEASKEMLHLALDIGGLVPVIGEVCDIANGIIYAIEGDGVNATLSLGSAIPLGGWFVTGAKFGYKGSLKFVVKADNFVDFGGRNSKKFREALGMAPGGDWQAHHIISRASDVMEHKVVQNAAKSRHAFHIDEALNGIPVEAWRNQPNHPDYTNRVLQKLEDFSDLNPNATPEECYTFLTDLIDDIRSAITNNPNQHLNNIIF